MNISQEYWDNYISNDTILKPVEITNAFGGKSFNFYADNITFSLDPNIITQKIRAKRSYISDQDINAYIGYKFFKGRKIILDYGAGKLSIRKED